MSTHKLESATIGIWRMLLMMLVWAALSGGATGSCAQTNTSSAELPSSAFNIATATRSYLDRLTPDKKQRSDAYFEGGYWLQLWGLLYGLGVGVLLVVTRLSVRMRDLVCRVTRFKALQIAGYWLQYVVDQAY